MMARRVQFNSHLDQQIRFTDITARLGCSQVAPRPRGALSGRNCAGQIGFLAAATEPILCWCKVFLGNSEVSLLTPT